MTRPDRESRFDDVDMQGMSTIGRAAYLADLRVRMLETTDPYMERACELRIAETERWQAIVNRRETERQDAASVSVTDRLRDALLGALREVVLHNDEYKHVTPLEQIEAWRALIAEATKESDHG